MSSSSAPCLATPDITFASIFGLSVVAWVCVQVVALGRSLIPAPPARGRAEHLAKQLRSIVFRSAVTNRMRKC